MRLPTPASSNLKPSLLELIDMARKSTPTTIADALRCVRKVKQGKACTQAEIKGALMLLSDALKTSQGKVRELKGRVAFMLPFTKR